MSRRDTIITAVLLNTGLLAVLFILAAMPGEDRSMISPQPEMAKALSLPQLQEPVIKQERLAPVPVILADDNSGDEVDIVLKDFAATLQAETLIRPEAPKAEEKELIATAPVRRATPPPSTQWEQEQSFVEVTIKDGDILGRIAQANGTTVGAIKKVNNLTNDRLKVGQVIRVPVGTKAVADAPPAKKQTTDVQLSYYVIQSGDNPWKIAKKFSVSVKELLRLNDLDEARARNLKPGDRIRVR